MVTSHKQQYIRRSGLKLKGVSWHTLREEISSLQALGVSFCLAVHSGNAYKHVPSN